MLHAYGTRRLLGSDESDVIFSCLLGTMQGHAVFPGSHDIEDITSSSMTACSSDDNGVVYALVRCTASMNASHIARGSQTAITVVHNAFSTIVPDFL